MITLEIGPQNNNQEIPEGRYHAVLVSIAEVPPNKFRPNVPRIRFDFQLLDQGQGRKVSAYCSKSTHPKSNLIKWLLALGKQISLNYGEKFSFGEDLYGREAVVDIISYARPDGSIGSRVRDVYAYYPKPDAQQVSSGMRQSMTSPQTQGMGMGGGQQFSQTLFSSAPGFQPTLQQPIQQPIQPTIQQQVQQPMQQQIPANTMPQYQNNIVDAGDQRSVIPNATFPRNLINSTINQPSGQADGSQQKMIEVNASYGQNSSSKEPPSVVRRNAFVREVPADKIKF